MNKKNALIKLTIKQRKWIKEYINTGNATEAAIRVYDCKNRETASNIGYENVRKLEFPQLMEDMGITDVALLNAGAEGLQAKKITGTSDNFVETEDYPTRHRYWETLLKLKGRLSNTNINAQINLFNKASSQMDEFIEGEEA